MSDHGRGGEDWVGKAPGFRTPGTIMLNSGDYADPFLINWEDVRWKDVAHATGNICRYTGHCSKFYSVAEHMLRCSEAVREIFRWQDYTENRLVELERWLHVHDAPEFVIGDINRPLKMQPEMEFYRENDDRLMGSMAEALGLAWPMPAEVKLVDNILLATEVRDLMGNPGWEGLPTPLPHVITSTYVPSGFVSTGIMSASEAWVERFVSLFPEENL